MGALGRNGPMKIGSYRVSCTIARDALQDSAGGARTGVLMELERLRHDAPGEAY